MPRPKQTLTIEQLKEIIENRAGEETFTALQRWAKNELKRREKAGLMGGKPLQFPNSKRHQQLREAQKHFQAKQKEKGK